MSVIGELALWGALLSAAWAVAAGIIAVRRPARIPFAESGARAITVTAVLLALATAGVVTLLLDTDFNYAFAATSTAANLPRPDRLVAFLSRVQGDVLLGATLVALFAAFASARVRALPRVTLATGAILFLLLASTLLLANPYARAAVAASDGAGLDAAWRLPWTGIARLAVVLSAAATLTAVSRTIGGASSWGLVLGGALIGAAATAFSVRRSIGGPAGNDLEWVLLAVLTLGGSLLPFRGSSPPRPMSWLRRVLAIATFLALLPVLWGLRERASTPVALHGAAPASATSPSGEVWTFVSSGRSVYDELDRRVLAVVVDAGERSAPVRHARVEWRVYLDPAGDERAQAPVGAVLGGPFLYTAIAFTAPPTDADAALTVTWVPYFGFAWIALGFLAAWSIASIVEESRAA